MNEKGKEQLPPGPAADRKEAGSPWVPAAASVVLPGLGQFLNRQFVKGLLWLAIPLLLVGIEVSTSHWNLWWKMQSGEVAVTAPAPDNSSVTSSSALNGAASSSSDDLYSDAAPAASSKKTENKKVETKKAEPQPAADDSDDLYGDSPSPAPAPAADKKAGSAGTASTSGTPATASTATANSASVAGKSYFDQSYVYPNYAATPEESPLIFRDFGGFFTKGIWGVVTLGKLVIDQKYAGQNIELFNKISNWLTADNSIQLLGNGLMALVILLLFAFFWVLGVVDAYHSKKQLLATGEKESFREFSKRISETMFAYVASAPALIVILFFTLIPFLFTFILAFTNYTYKVHLGQDLIHWVGFDTFQFLLMDPDWLKIFGNIFVWTVFWAFMSSFTVFALGFVNAMIVESPLVRGRKFWRGLLIIPWALPQLIALMVFKNVFDKDGLMNQLLFSTGTMDAVTHFLYSIGLEGKPDSPIFWFQQVYNGGLAKCIVVLVNLWFGAPYFMMMIIGILSSLPKDIYEAAHVDGASPYQKFRFITLPLVLAATVPVLIMTFSFNFNNFGAVYFLTGGGPAWNIADIPPSMQIISSALPGQTDILISWIYKLSFVKDFEQFNVAAVYSILIFLIVGGFATFNMVRTKSFKDEGALE